MTETLPYGSWPSPITPGLIVEGAASLADTWEENGTVWWSELRPSEGGRVQIVRRDADGACTDLLPEGFNARTKVHEYGGGAWWVFDGTVYFANWADQRLYRLDVGSSPVPITPEPPIPAAWRYADGRITPDGSAITCVREDHTGEGEARNEIVSLPVDGSHPPHVLISGRDFISAPRPSPDGRQLAWITWDHPNMPWDDTELWVAHIETTGGRVLLERPKRVAGGVGESVMQPVWNRHGSLHVISDRSDMWTVYRVDGVDVLTPMLEADGEVGGPAWLFGHSDYGFTQPDGDLVAAWSSDGGVGVARVSHDDGAQRTWRVPYVSLSSVRIDGQELVAIAASSDREAEVVRLGLAKTESEITVLRQSRELPLDPADISIARVVSFPSREGRVAHALFYAPSNSRFIGPSDELPPLIVKIHGGPTGAASVAFRLDIQYWTSRGFAVADVDYGGSSGYGRAYRKLLDGSWGVVDVEDCCAAAEYLAENGLVDSDRLAIRGGSAGGFTTLAALAFTDTFNAGANSYGVSDMAALAEDTHKFESRYLDSLIGRWPEAKQTYAERSPINHIEGFTVPLITFQGLDDEVVPPSQSEEIMEALDAAHVPHAYLSFEGEQHGFRRAATIKRVLDAELSFYGQVFGFEPSHVTEPVVIVHADALD